MRPILRQILWIFCFAGNDDTVTSPRRIYTVDLPPEGYVAVTPDALSNAVNENSGSSADSTGKFCVVVTVMNFSEGKLLSSSYQVDSDCKNKVFKALLPVGVTVLQHKQNEDVHPYGFISIVWGF